MHQTYSLEIDGASFDARIWSVRGRERVHAPSRWEVSFEPVVRGAPVAVDPKTLLTQKAKLSWSLTGGGTREIDGLVDVVEAVHTRLSVVIVPKIALLADAVDHRVFVDQDTVEIVQQILSEHGITADVRVQRSLPKRAQCVQLFESDLDFVSRLVADEGASWYIPAGAADKIVITDHAVGYDDVDGAPTLKVKPRRGLVEMEEAVFEVGIRGRTVSDKVTLRDYDFEKPLLDQTVEADAGSSARERYEYPGSYLDSSVGKARAGLRLDQLRARRLVLQGSSSSPRLSAGHVVKLDDPEHARIAGRWLLLEVEHQGDDYHEERADGRRYACTFTAVPADGGYREPRVPPPQVGGIQTGVVTGAGGAEIQTEKHGRVKAHLRWDRLRPLDDTASTDLRVVQPPTSGGFFLPRVGWEGLLAFEHGAADVPYVVGRLYNGQAPPPSGLPGKKVVSAFGTRTTPGGGSANLVEMNDTAGNEGMNFNASKDFNERTENDKNTSITSNDSWSVGAARKLIVGQVLSVKVGGAQSYTIGGSRTVNVTSNKLIAAASETVMIGGLRTFNVGGDYKTGSASLARLVGGAKAETAIESVVRSVQGAQTVLVGGSWRTVAGVSHNVAVSGAATEVVAGAKSVKGSKYHLAVKGALNETLASRKVTAGGDRGEQFAAAASYDIGASASMKASEITVKADSKITIKAGGVTITITSGEIKIDGDVNSKVDSSDAGDQEYGD